MINTNFVNMYYQCSNVSKIFKKSKIYICILGLAGCSTTVPIEDTSKFKYTAIPVGKYSNQPRKFVASRRPQNTQTWFKSANANSNQQFMGKLVRRQFNTTFNKLRFQNYYQQKGFARSTWNSNHGKYGMTRRSKYGLPKKHNGVDIAGNIGDYVYSVSSGIAEISPTGTHGKLGLYVRINERNGYYTDHAHLSRVAIKNGTWVNAGDLIGYIGKTGNVPYNAMSHVHISRWKKSNGKQFFVNPTNLVFGNVTNPYVLYGTNR